MGEKKRGEKIWREKKYQEDRVLGTGKEDRIKLTILTTPCFKTKAVISIRYANDRLPSLLRPPVP